MLVTFRHTAPLAALVLAAAPAAFAATLTPQPAADQRLVSAQGKPIIVSPGQRGEIGLALVEQSLANRGGAPLFLLSITNGSDGAENLTEGNVSVSADGRPVKVLTLRELTAQARADTEREVNTARGRAQGSQQSVGGSLVDDPGMSRPTSQVIGNTVVTAGRNAPGGVGGLAGAARNTRDADRRLEDRMAAAQQLGLRPLMVAPGEHAATPLTLSPLPRGTRVLTLVVTLAGEPHTFVYAVAP